MPDVPIWQTGGKAYILLSQAIHRLLSLGHIFTDAPPGRILYLGNDLSRMIQSSLTWQSECARKAVRTRCVTVTIPLDRSYDPTINLCVGSAEMFNLVNMLNLDMLNPSWSF